MFARVLAEAGPNLSDAQLMAHATLVTAQTEGLVAFMRPDDPAGLSVESIREALDLFAEGIFETIARQSSRLT